ncbi:alpha-ribazole phosphatase [Burkholderia sp. Ac-20379]|uniref:alpha-ribazole phosphatase n=1 Tax=Burkholderia sp. Ac-20379 TaxID=2703900 RepID=UPI00197D4FF3|nr:alpha-ribazole phosphatase [Burkholderia sp. Ac-20379]MBN3728627.1 alpha-ribazole phosphatase [Burkholderia sp. Ac-20379]
MDVVLIRHPAPAVEAGVCYGASDVPLAGDAAREARAIVARVDALGLARPSAIDSSPLVRCASVARDIGAAMRCDVRVDARLREIDFGAWEMRSWDEIGRDALDRWQADLMGAREHGGESAAQLMARVAPLGAAWRESAAQGSVVCVTHAGVMRALAAQWLGVPLERLLARRIAYGGCLWFAHDAVRGWQLRGWDETDASF